MDKQDTVHLRQSSKQLIGLTLMAMILSLSLIYSLLKSPKHKQKTKYTPIKLNLPTKPVEKIHPMDEPPPSKWTTLIVKPGDTLGSLFKRANISQKELQAILHNNQHIKLLTGIRLNQKIKLLIDNNRLEKLVIAPNNKEYLIVSRDDNGYRSELKSKAVTYHDQYITASIQGSLYATAKRMNIPYQLIQQMTDIFNWQIDFSKDVHSGDQFSVVYKGSFIDDKLVNVGQILAVTYRTQRKTFQAIRHVNLAGDIDYYTPEGNSLKKAFSRYPIKFSHISSTFSLSRKHPILHYNRPHKGVDLAAPIGTVIRATGDGRIIMIGRHSGYGNMIKLSHNKLYTSIYGHLLKFQAGLHQGDFIKRGQIIGYVGQSGLATAPHCHYEFHVNNQPKNPSTVELPQSASLNRREMALFSHQATTLLAQLKLYQEGTLAAANKASHTA